MWTERREEGNGEERSRRGYMGRNEQLSIPAVGEDNAGAAPRSPPGNRRARRSEGEYCATPVERGRMKYS